MSDTETLDMIQEDALPGHEIELEPDWVPRFGAPAAWTSPPSAPSASRTA